MKKRIVLERNKVVVSRDKDSVEAQKLLAQGWKEVLPKVEEPKKEEKKGKK